MDWLGKSIANRLPEIARKGVAENTFDESINARINALADEMPEATLRLLDDDGPDIAAWNEAIQPYLDQDWLDTPWFPAATYFFSRIIEATG